MAVRYALLDPLSLLEEKAEANGRTSKVVERIELIMERDLSSAP